MISNHGSGINEEFKDKVLNKFSQGDSSNSRQKEGIGLRLAITKQLVEIMKDIITCDSQPNVLTTFCAELPIL